MQQTPQNYAEYRIRRHTLTKRAHMSEETGTPRKMHQRIRIRRIYHPAEDQAERLPGGVGRPPGSAEPGLVPVQVHFEEEWLPRHLITFHMCVGGKPTSRPINR